MFQSLSKIVDSDFFFSKSMTGGCWWDEKGHGGRRAGGRGRSSPRGGCAQGPGITTALTTGNSLQITASAEAPQSIPFRLSLFKHAHTHSQLGRVPWKSTHNTFRGNHHLFLGACTPHRPGDRQSPATFGSHSHHARPGVPELRSE